MRDDQILDLVRMASEAQDLERGSALRLVGEPARRSLGGRVGVLMALAAAVAGAVYLWPAPVSPGSASPLLPNGLPNGLPGGERLATGAEAGGGEVVPATMTVSEAIEGPMLLAVFHQKDARCDCVVWKPLAFAGGDIETLDSEALMNAALAYRCSDDTSLVLAIALDGPRDMLPTTREGAMELAATLSLPRAECGTSSECYERKATDYLSPSIRVLAETLATTGT